MKKFLSTMLALALLASATACGGQAAQSGGQGAEDGGTVQLEALSFMGEDTKRAGFDALIEAYTAQNPGVSINVQHLDYGSFTTTLQTRIAAGDAPDLIFGTAILNQALVQSGQIEDLTGQPVLEKFTEDELASGTIDGKVYGVPLDRMVIGVFYNKDMFAARGLEPPTTLKEFHAVIQAFEAEGVVPFVRPFKDGAYAQYDLDTQLYPLVDKTGNTTFFTDLEQGKTSFATSPEMREALELFADRLQYLSGDDLGTDPSVATQLFAAGEYPMYINGSWVVGDLEENNPDGNFGIFPAPISNTPADNKMYAAVDDAWMVSSQSEYKPQALDFLDFISSDEGLSIWASKARAIPLKAVDAGELPAVLREISEMLDEGIGVNVDKYIYFSGEGTDKFNQNIQLFVNDLDVDAFLALMDNDFANIAG